MPARKDDGQKPPEGGRRGVIWRLPATRDADDSANASAATEAEPPRRGRRVPLSVVAGLSVALVLVGLYAAWSEVGRDMLSESRAPESAAVPAPAAQAVDPSGDGAAGAGAATPPSGDGAGAPAVIAEAGADDAGGAASGQDAAPVVASGAGIEADAPPQAAEPVDDAAPASAPAAASASDDETTSDRAAAEIGADAGVDMSAAVVAAASADDAPLPLADDPTEASPPPPPPPMRSACSGPGSMRSRRRPSLPPAQMQRLRLWSGGSARSRTIRRVRSSTVRLPRGQSNGPRRTPRSPR